ncbi:hypothetical protein C0J52_10206 [Blattella germanica]|nr:hypothetical protein C0J52_10206 [Blattella germanica]
MKQYMFYTICTAMLLIRALPNFRSQSPPMQHFHWVTIETLFRTTFPHHFAALLQKFNLERIF